MTRDDVIAMAHEAGMRANTSKDAIKALSTSIPVQWLEHFATLVAAAEREACAQVAQSLWRIDGQFTADEFAAEIRVRGIKEQPEYDTDDERDHADEDAAIAAGKVQAAVQGRVS
jgi:hypothetical protein